MPNRPVHTEHVLFECAVSEINVDSSVMLFRAPTVHDGSGTHKRLPHRIRLDEVQEGDSLIVIDIDRVGEAEIITELQFWDVRTKNPDGSLVVHVNNIVGSSGDGEYVYDRIAGLLGKAPSKGQ